MGFYPSGTALFFCLFALLVPTSQAISLRPRSLRGPAGSSMSAVHHEQRHISGNVIHHRSHHAKAFPWNVMETAFGWWYFAIVELKALVFTYWALIVLSSTIWTMMLILAAYKYKGSERYFPEIGPSPEDPTTTRKQLSKWHFAWYHCAADLDICFWSFCCPWIRWAHTLDLLHLFEYWPALAIFFMLEMVNQITGFVFIGFYFTLLLVYYRQKIRKVFGMQKHGTVAGIVEDFACLCCCMPCTIAQEAQHVKFAAEMGYPLPACMAESGGAKKLPMSATWQRGALERQRLAQDDLEDRGTSSSQSQSFHDVMSRMSTTPVHRDSPALPHNEPLLVFGSLFHHSRTGSRSSSRGMGLFRGNGSGRRSRSSSREDHVARVRQRPKASPTAKPKAIMHSSSSSTSHTLARRGTWHPEAQNPMPERLLAQPPVRAGAPGEVRPGKVNFVQFLVTLHDDLRAYAFLFVEVGCVGRCGASCRTLHAYMWNDRAFWQFYCGTSVNDRLAQPFACPAHALREAFRRWIFHIDGVWTKDFREFVDKARESTSGADLSLMLSYARYIVSGLMPYDSRPAIAEFTNIMCELLAEYNPEKADERNAAEAMTAQVECMAEVFSEAQIKLILSAFDCSLGRAVSAPSEPESDHEPAWVIPGIQEMAGDPMQEAPLDDFDDEDLVDPPWGDHEILWFG